MKRRNKEFRIQNSEFRIFLIIMCLLLTFFSGCSIMGRKAVHPNEKDSGEEIDPFDYGDEFIRPEFGRKTTPETNQSNSGEKDDVKVPAGIKDVSDTTGRQTGLASRGTSTYSDVYGYRVQIGIDEDKELMEKLEQSARSKVNMEVYLEFEAPFYRVRVGDFKTRAEAQRYEKILKDTGFKDARWLISKINPQ